MILQLRQAIRWEKRGVNHNWPQKVHALQLDTSPVYESRKFFCMVTKLKKRKLHINTVSQITQLF